MQEGDAFAFSTEPRGLIHEGDPGVATRREHGVEVVHGETQVMDPRPAFVQILGDRGVGALRFKELDQRVTGGNAGDAGPVAVAEGHDRESEDVAKEGEGIIDGANGEAEMRDGGAAGGLVRSSHGQRASVGKDVLQRNPISGGRARPPAKEHCMGQTLAVTDDDFATSIEGHKGLAVVDFWATWCGPCRMIAPIMEELAVKYDGQVKITKLDVDTNPKSAARFGVRSIPTILFFKDGQVVDQVIGAVPKAALEAKVAQHS